MSVPDHVSGVVVAARAERLSQEQVIRRMHEVTAHWAPVLTSATPTPRQARHSILGEVVHLPERWCCEGDEEPGVIPDDRGCALATAQAGADEVKRIPSMQARARYAPGLPAVSAADC